MTALDQADAEAGYVIDLSSGWWLLAAATLIAFACVLSSWRHRLRTRRDARWADIDALLAAERRSRR